jgi:hypothetical protein
MADDFTGRYGDLLTGSYDCVDRIVLNAYYPLGHNPGGFRVWWRRWHGDSNADLDDARLMRPAGRFARRVRAWAKANGVPVIDCKAGERKHRIAGECLAENTVGTGVFMILVARARATVWKVKRSAAGVISHYSFRIMDPAWGHLVVKMSGHPPFGAQVILNGHEHVACAAQAEGTGFKKEGNCFTEIADPRGLAQIAETLSQDAAIGRLGQACDRWICTACLVFGLDLAEQQASGFRYAYSVYQAEYSRNLIFASGARMDRVFGTVADRTRSRLDVPALRTSSGMKKRPAGTHEPSMKLAVVIERPEYDLTKFKVHFGQLTLKGYTKGERVLRFEAIVHNTKVLKTGRGLDKFPEITARLAGMADRFCTMLDCVDTGFIPGGFTVADFAAKVRDMTGQAGYTIRNAAYDLRKLRGKHLADEPGRTRRYLISPGAARIISALLTLREQAVAPLLAGVADPRIRRTPRHWTDIDRHYQAPRLEMMALFADIGIACG